MWWSRKTRDKTLPAPLIFDFQLFLKLQRTEIAQTWMPPNSIVITFDVAEDFWPCLFDRFKDAAFDQFRLKARKETLRLRVVITIPLTAHTLSKAVNIKQPTIFCGSILTASVGMNNRSAFYQTALPRSVKSINHQLRRHPLWDLPADDSSREFILKGRQIAPLSILQWQICDVADQTQAVPDHFVHRIAQQIRHEIQSRAGNRWCAAWIVLD